MKKQVKSRIRREAKNQGNIALSARDSTSAWDYIRKVTFTEHGTSESFIDVDLLNDFFANIVTASNEEELIITRGCDTDSSFNLRQLPNIEVCKALKSVKSKTASGPDKIVAHIGGNF